MLDRELLRLEQGNVFFICVLKVLASLQKTRCEILLSHLQISRGIYSACLGDRLIENSQVWILLKHRVSLLL